MIEFDGFVLAGGRSTRMGSDKALVEVDGTPMVTIAVDALEDARSVTVVGGDGESFRALGHRWIPDDTHGAGPLVGFRTALRQATTREVVVLSCDLPRIDAASVHDLLPGLVGAECSVPLVDGRLQWLASAWNVERARSATSEAAASGARSVHSVAARLTMSVLLPTDERRFDDADSPAELSNALADLANSNDQPRGR